MDAILEFFDNIFTYFGNTDAAIIVSYIRGIFAKLFGAKDAE